MSFFGISTGTLIFWLLFQFQPLLAVIALFSLIVFFFAFHLHWGFFILLAVGFFHGLEIDFSRYEFARTVPYLPSINAPLVDFIAIILLLSLFTSVVLKQRNISLKEVCPGWQWYGSFVLVATISAYFSYERNILPSFNYLFRGIIFSYAAFVILPSVLIRKRETMERVFALLCGVGIAISLYGLSSFLFAAQGTWLRVIPYGLFGIAPLGYNHNLIAEPLVAIIPLAWYLFMSRRADVTGFVYGIGACLMTIAALLTLSRAGWIVLGLEATFFFIWYRAKIFAWLSRHTIISVVSALLGFVVLSYMAIFLQSSIVASSNKARFETTGIVLFYAARSPLIGMGPGMYTTVLGNTAMYALEFGEPLDAHGFLQKVLLEEGVLGLVLFCSFLLWALMSVWKRTTKKTADTRLHRALFLMMLAAIVFQLFNTSYFNANMWLAIGIALSGLTLRKSLFVH